uniref:Uncharacterized protein n=1 Tax=Manihot esculenta TaxID=3983 RepID=A0A2C9WPW2_MANES
MKLGRCLGRSSDEKEILLPSLVLERAREKKEKEEYPKFVLIHNFYFLQRDSRSKCMYTSIPSLLGLKMLHLSVSLDI